MDMKAIIGKGIVVLLALVFVATSGASFADEQYNTWLEVADGMSEHLDEAVSIYVQGDEDSAKAAKESVNVAYFKFYEKLGFEKTVMAAISGKRGSAVEWQFHVAKRVLKDGGTNEEFKTEIEALKVMLYEDAEFLDNRNKEKQGAEESSDASAEQTSTGTAEGMSSESEQNTESSEVVGGPGMSAGDDWFTFSTVFALTMREGLEAILVIAAIVAYLLKTNNNKQVKTVYIGALLGVVFSVVLAMVFNYIAKVAGDSQAGFGQEVFEGMAMFLAVIVLFYVSNWMLSKSETEIWSQYIKDKVETSVSRGNAFALAFSAFLAVAREGAELILFFQGMRSNIANSPSQMWMGIAAAAVLLLIVYFAIAKYSVKLPLKPFFVATSILMFVMCISFLGKGVFELQEVDVIGRTLIPGFPESEALQWFGIYGRYENFIPQVILFVVTIISVVLHSKNNKKKRAELEMRNNK